MASDAIPKLDVAQLKALTHPLRIRLLKELRTNGAATATLLARRLGESSGATSYHLRQLARHGFVEEARDVGDGRDRWWRPAFHGHRVEAATYLDDPEHRAVLATYESYLAETYAGMLDEFVASQDSWSREWRESVEMSYYRLRLTPKQLQRLAAVVRREVERFERYDSPGAEQVTVLFQAFPRRARPFTEEGA